MRQDQFEKLQEYSEKLIDVLVEEMNPENWPGHGIAPNMMDAGTRGDRFWAKKNPIATVTLAMKLNSLIDTARRATAGGGQAGAVDEPHDDMGDEVAAAEREAKRFMNNLWDKAGVK